MKRAFTLIELLVVIAIIAILAAILFPVFAQAKLAAKKTSNISNHKQVCTSTLMYEGDADDQYPLAYTLAGVGPQDGLTVSNNKAVYTWQNLVQPYSKNWAILIDPISPWQHNDPKKFIDPFLNYGMLPRAELAGMVSWADTWWVPKGTAKFQGLTGLGADDPDGALVGSGFVESGYKPTPSMTQTSVANAAGTMLAADATFTDMWLLPFMNEIGTDAFDYCISWGGVYSQSVTTGPWNRYNASDASWCSAQKNYKGNGTTEFTDGHAKCIPIGETFKTAKDAAGDTVYVHMWPTESL